MTQGKNLENMVRTGRSKWLVLLISVALLLIAAIVTTTVAYLIDDDGSRSSIAVEKPNTTVFHTYNSNGSNGVFIDTSLRNGDSTPSTPTLVFYVYYKSTVNGTVDESAPVFSDGANRGTFYVEHTGSAWDYTHQTVSYNDGQAVELRFTHSENVPFGDRPEEIRIDFIKMTDAFIRSGYELVVDQGQTEWNVQTVGGSASTLVYEASLSYDGTGNTEDGPWHIFCELKLTLMDENEYEVPLSAEYFDYSFTPAPSAQAMSGSGHAILLQCETNIGMAPEVQIEVFLSPEAPAGCELVVELITAIVKPGNITITPTNLIN